MTHRMDDAVPETVERDGPAGRVVIRRQAQAGERLIVISGYAGAELPAALRDVRVGPDGANEGAWRLDAAEGSFRFRADAVDVIEARPGLYEPLHRRFALSTTDRFAVRILLWLLRLPGGARLLRRWHAGRTH